jgi:multiple sugar transport system substrate-binding protein
MDRYERWVYEEHLIPTPAEWQSFNVDAGYSPSFSLFCRGEFAAIRGGRWFAIFMRQIKKPVTIGTMLPPNGGYPVTDFVFGGISMYRNSPRKEASAWYLRYFLSSNYNRELARDSDGLPPDTRYWSDPELLRPSKHTNEWAFHEPYTNIFYNHSCAPEDSPFLQATQYDRSRGQFGYWDARHKSAAEAWALFSLYLSEEIKRNLKHKPDDLPRYEAAVKVQKQIDEYKAAGKKIPSEWIANPFLRKYYKDTGR